MVPRILCFLEHRQPRGTGWSLGKCHSHTWLGVLRAETGEVLRVLLTCVFSQAAEERNYHIFYCMLMGMSLEEKNMLGLGMPSEYHYLTMGNCTSYEGLSDAKDYAHVRSAMKILQFSDSENWDISKLLAAILHLGNVGFMAAVFENLDSSDVMETPAFPFAMKLLEVLDPLSLLVWVLVAKTLRA